MEEHDYVLSDIFENSSIFPFPKGLHLLSFIFHIDRYFLRNVYFSIYLQYVVPTFESNILFIKGALQMPD
jgi:hypothetical protein